jgi:hypothetical protein
MTAAPGPLQRGPTHRTEESTVFSLTEDLARDRIRELRADADAAARARRLRAARRWSRRAERATRRAARASAAVR